MKNKSKYFKNPERGQIKPFQPYVPQWQLWGREPTEAGKIPNNVAQQTTKHAPFVSYLSPKIQPAPTIGQNVPFAEEVSANLGHAPLPNIGNNVENTWAGIDGMTIDNEDVTEVDINKTMIDNNYDDPRNYNSIPKVLKQPPEPQRSQDNSNDMIESDTGYLDIGLDDAVLVVCGEIISIAPLSSIEEEVRSLVFGEHPLSKTNNITIDDILVLKRIKIKVGVFLE